MHKKTRNERRDFLKKSGTAMAAVTILPSNVISGLGYTAPSDKLNIAGIGVGGMGRRNLRNMNSQNIVALADVDWTYAKRCFNDYPKAKLYKDYRKMLSEMDKDIDAIMISTP
ncbi:MAG: Gfo/Idh/MocA family oxidoreductase, partial [Eudoraea sp.]|nr:Gfo/Idh/MocA family oxidoreductase [Eudoraea sp.]